MQLFEWEPPEPRASWEPWIRAGYVVFAIAFSLTVVVDAFAHESVMLGLGLVDEGGTALTRLESQFAGVSPSWLAVKSPTRVMDRLPTCLVVKLLTWAGARATIWLSLRALIAGVERAASCAVVNVAS